MLQWPFNTTIISLEKVLGILYCLVIGSTSKCNFGGFCRSSSQGNVATDSSKDMGYLTKYFLITGKTTISVNGRKNSEIALEHLEGI
jgi:hypothetical protein